VSEVASRSLTAPHHRHPHLLTRNWTEKAVCVVFVFYSFLIPI